MEDKKDKVNTIEVDSVMDSALSKEKLLEILSNVYGKDFKPLEKNDEHNAVKPYREVTADTLVQEISSYSKPHKKRSKELKIFLKELLKKYDLNKETKEIIIKTIRKKAKNNDKFINLRFNDVSIDSAIVKNIQSELLENGFIMPSYKIYCDNQSCYNFISKAYDVKYQRILNDIFYFLISNSVNSLKDLKNKELEKILENFLNINIIDCISCGQKVDFEYMYKLYLKHGKTFFTLDFFKFNVK